METKRAQTLEALETFIQSQKALLTRTQSDITRLQDIRNDATSHPTLFLSNIDAKFSDNAFRLSDQRDAKLVLPHSLDWSIYDAHDPKALQDLTHDACQKYDQRNKPCPYQHSDLSELQKFVKDARRTIVDPILAVFECMSDLEDDDSEELDAEEVRREREREKLRELKKRKIQTWGGLRLPSPGASGVYILHDVEDESIEVDITLDDNSPILHRQSFSQSPMDVDMSPMAPGSYVSSSNPKPKKKSKSSSQHLLSVQRCRKPSKKVQMQIESEAKSVPTIKKQKPRAPPRAEDDDSSQGVPSASTSSRPKPKSETYKQAWSDEEQYLLEQLLEQIPDGEKNRWQKISRAMNGKRTPRQVASRVQKYFEKLKRFGIDDG